MLIKKLLMGVSCVLFIGALLVTGCDKGKEKGFEKAEKTAVKMGTLQENLKAAGQQIDATMDALEAVMKSTDLKKDFDQFSKEMDKLDAQAKVTGERADQMKKRGTAYFDSWAKDIGELETEAVKQLAEAQRKKRAEKYEGVILLMGKVRDAYQPFMSDLGDIKKVLEKDLSPAGVKSLAPFAKKVKESAGNVMKEVSALQAALDEVSAMLAPPVPAKKG